MKYNLSFIRSTVYQANLIDAPDEATARAYYNELKPDAEIVGISPATSSDDRPGKPLIIVPTDYTPKAESTPEPEKTPTETESPATVRTLDLLDNLDTGDHGDQLNDHRDSDGYICDIIAEIADANTSIYYRDILDFIRRNPDSLADVIDEGLFDPSRDYDLYKHAQAAEFMTIERDIYDHLADSLMAAAVNFIRFDLDIVEIPEELADLLREWCDDADNNDRMNDIPDKIREYLDDFTEEVSQL